MTKPAYSILVVLVVALIGMNTVHGKGNSKSKSQIDGAPSAVGVVHNAPFDDLVDFASKSSNKNRPAGRRFMKNTTVIGGNTVSIYAEGILPANRQLNDYILLHITKSTKSGAFDFFTVDAAGATQLMSDTAYATTVNTKTTCGRSTVAAFVQSPQYRSSFDQEISAFQLRLGPNASTAVGISKCAPTSVAALSGIVAVEEPFYFNARVQYARVKSQTQLALGDSYDAASKTYIIRGGDKKQFKKRPFWVDTARQLLNVFVTQAGSSNAPFELSTVLRNKDRKNEKAGNQKDPVPMKMNKNIKAALCEIGGFTSYSIYTDFVGKGDFMDSPLTYSTVDELHQACEDSPADDECFGFTTYTETLSDGSRIEKPWSRHRNSGDVRNPSKKDEFVDGLTFYAKPTLAESTCNFELNTKSATMNVFLEQTFLGTSYASVFLNGKFVKACGAANRFEGDGALDVNGEDGNCGSFKLCVSIPNLSRKDKIQIVPQRRLVHSPCNASLTVLVNITSAISEGGVDEEEEPEDDTPAPPPGATPAPPTTPSPPTPMPPTPAPPTPVPPTPRPPTPVPATAMPPTPAPATPRPPTPVPPTPVPPALYWFNQFTVVTPGPEMRY